MVSRIEAIKRRELRKQLYSLGHRFGVPAEVYSLVDGIFNPATGKKTSESYTRFLLRKFISFSVTYAAKFEYDLSFIAANKNFTYGAEFEVGDRVAIILRSEGPQDIVFNDMWIVYNEKRFDILKKEEIDFNLGWILQLRHVQGSKRTRIVDKYVTHYLTVEQSVNTA